MAPAQLRTCLFLLILAVMIGTVAIAPSSGATISVVADQNSVTVTMSLNLRENFTSLPLARVFLSPSNSTPVLLPMQSAIQKLAPGSRIDSLSGLIDTRLVDPSNQAWSLEENYTLGIGGITTNLGGTVMVNTAFLRMNVSDAVRVGSLEVNNLGRAYIVQPLQGLPRTPTSRYIVDGHIFTNLVIPGNSTVQFNLLDFTWVPALSLWNHALQPFGPSVWETAPSPPFNLTVGVQQIENTLTPIYSAVYSASLSLKAPPRAWLQGNVISFDLPTTTDYVMPVIILAILVAGLVVFFADRRLTKTARFKKKKRDR